jgi:hypothetical protein
VEQLTRTQIKSKIWFKQTLGRVTASKLKAVVSTDPSQPSISLLKSICYFEASTFTSIACTYVQNHEDEAWRLYVSNVEYLHNSFVLSEVGLMINPQ